MNMTEDEITIEDESVTSEPQSNTAGTVGVQDILDSLGNGGAQVIMDALGSGASGESIINSFISQAQIPAEQQSLLNLLMSMSDNQTATGQVFDVDSELDELDEDESFYGTAQPKKSKVSDIRQFRQELNDLRDVNDTLAAALGACPVCWGGDTGCEECQGKGYSGSARPDAQLFKELVLPAVRRMRAVNKSHKAGITRKRR
ncbi:MAG: hypothetical protein OQK98_06640 [Gammaproteobacteria bacterium]|nr:hypothetical protein [Gammaproteobacteria bacterium]